MKQKPSLVLLLFLLLASCSKWQDKPGPQVDLSRKYCNLPDAINYNYDFPGTEDSSVCIFPAQPFAGQYSYSDSLYMGTNPVVNGDTFNFNITQVSRSGMHINAFCGARSLSFTANRYYRATADTTITGYYGQLLCRDQDTLTGSMVYKAADSSLQIEFTVVSDTGVVVHRGTAYKK